MPDICDYTDYRLYLMDMFSAKKEKNPNFSYRFIAQKCGFKSPGPITQILQGKTTISNALALRLGRFLKLNSKELDYFVLMVSYCQAHSHTDRKQYYEKLHLLRLSKVTELDENQYE